MVRIHLADLLAKLDLEDPMEYLMLDNLGNPNN